MICGGDKREILYLRSFVGKSLASIGGSANMPAGHGGRVGGGVGGALALTLYTRMNCAEFTPPAAYVLLFHNLS